MAFNNWPYSNFQDLNLGWIIATYKNALNKALEALGKANAVEATVGTYTDQINAATLTANQASATANQAMELANTANELLYIFDHGESKAQNFVKYVEGETVFVSATDIFVAITGDHKLPVFMDRNNYIYDMAGFETNPENPLEVARFRFIRDGGDRQYIVWIDRSANITYTTAYSGVGTLDVNFTSLQSTGQTSCDKTYAEVSQAYNSGMTVRCHVVDEIHHVEYYAYDCEFIENDETGDYFRWCSPYVSAISGFYKPFLREDELCNIGTTTISGGGGSGISIQDVIDTVNDGDTNALLYTAQTLSAAQQAQVKQNLGISDGNEDFLSPAIPSPMYLRLNKPMSIFKRNIMRPSYELAFGNYTNATDIKAYDNETVIEGTATGTKSVQCRTLNSKMAVENTKFISVVISDTAPGTKSMLAIGDSFLTQNSLVKRIIELFSADSGVLTTIGTGGNSEQHYEGYAGKKWTDFADGFSGSPFGESDFNFSSYMTTQGYSAPDYVYIQLGTNDVSASAPISSADVLNVVSAARKIINNIHQYNSSIKIAVGLTVMPTLDAEKFAERYNGIGWNWIMRWNMQVQNKAIMDAFADTANVRIVPNNLCLNSAEDISDNVHPNSRGYHKIADAVYNTIAGW